MTRTEAIDNTMQEIQGLWPSTIKDELVRKRVVGKLHLVYNRGRFQEVMTSLFENEQRRPENIINAIMRHSGIVHGYGKRKEEKPVDHTLADIDWEKHRQSDCAKMFQRICKCVENTGRRKLTPYGQSRYESIMTVDKEALCECYREMVRDPMKYHLSEMREMELRAWIQNHAAA